MTDRVAVIGAGPGGLVAARWLLSEGFVPTLFEQSPTLGGQWSGQLGRSGVWPAMRTNTSRVLTSFSDLAPSSDLVFPTCQEMLEYLHRYAAIFDLESRIRLETRVENLGRSGSGWRVRHSSGVEDFDRVVIASGRFQTPMIPAVAGLDGFTGSAGVRTTYDYRRPEPFVGKRMLVAGGAISALEIAVELAHGAAASVTVAQRRQRYVLPKFAAGVPSDHRMFTRYATLAHELLPTAEDERQLREIVLGAAGSPEQYGAPAPNPSLFAAGVTLSQNYLPAVAEGRISVRPWIQSVADASVTFVDGHTDEFDGIVFGTGFELRLPFLDDRLRDLLGLDGLQLDADRFTFHPDLPGLALMGMWEQSGRLLRAARATGPLDRVHVEWSGACTCRGRATGGDRRMPGATRHSPEVPNEPRGTDIRPGRGRRAASGELAGPTPGVIVRSAGAQLLPAGGPRCSR